MAPAQGDPPRNASPTAWATLPDMRTEQMVMLSSQPFMDVDSSEFVPCPGLLCTPWHRTRSVQWYVADSRRFALVRHLLWEQVVMPMWQGVLWGLLGVSLGYISRGARRAVPARPVRPRAGLGPLLARVGLGKLAV